MSTPTRPRVRLLVALGAAALGVSACIAGEPVSPDADSRNVVVGLAGQAEWPAADWTLVHAEIQDDTLVIRLRYTGGCSLHSFWLLAIDGWVDLPTAGPLATVAVPLRIAHDDHGDPCEASLAETLRFHLGPLRDAYRHDRGTAPATLLLRIPTSQGAAEFITVGWTI